MLADEVLFVGDEYLKKLKDRRNYSFGKNGTDCILRSRYIEKVL